jgi:hypothetical protein
MHVPNTRMHVFKVLDIRAIMGLQDVQTESVVKAYKAYIHVATVRLQCSASTMDHSPDTTTVPSESTARHHTADREQRGR